MIENASNLHNFQRSQFFFTFLGTHVDVVKDEFPPSFSEYLQQKIRDKFINISDPEKFGLPRVLDSIEVSCKTRQNIRLLANLLYDTAFSLKSPGTFFCSCLFTIFNLSTFHSAVEMSGVFCHSNFT